MQKEKEGKEQEYTENEPCPHEWAFIGVLENAADLRNSIYVLYCQRCAVVIQKRTDYTDMAEPAPVIPAKPEPQKPKEPGVTYG